ncbi:MAG: SDR family oxidoreductase [Rhodospirillaceae bacterium]|jgi:3-oxoacyl-[acyl-carrier protein] reductase|nr:SDR family oxidoreductase [Rhodospirillaceae bacterium]MBT4721286.1 SDR family oxidoreductase [Rhodospirillaceae bacterium]MBT5179015.1 SDR family oxidoreductase [Rhodospirillaceae bacterium]MBT5840726.1 SDR family oxidoreductase [Rhodospirillaceae bacterium]MBT6290267.1 SDR family oxidoreductase [Rhodospirillaceae bacterium]
MAENSKTVIVTGAARGLGQAYGWAFAEQGWRVVVADRDGLDQTMEGFQNPDNHLALPVDIADIASVQAMVAGAIDKFGAVDALINNAGLYGALTGGRAEDIDEAEWDRCMAVNVKGTWNCCRAIIPHMRSQTSGAIVNVASLAAVMGMPYGLHYTTSKAAVIGMTRALARELGRDSIRVNCIAPTAVNTEGTAEFFGDVLDKQMDAVVKSQSLRQALEPEDVVGTVLYLAGDASKLITGQTIMVDGGTVFL